MSRCSHCRNLSPTSPTYLCRLTCRRHKIVGPVLSPTKSEREQRVIFAEIQALFTSADLSATKSDLQICPTCRHIRRLAGPEIVYKRPVMWSETSPSILGQDRSEAKKSVLVLVLQMCCFVKHDVTLVVIMILKDTAINFSSTIYSFSILCLEHHYCGVQQLAFTYLKVKSARAFAYFRWSWSCYVGLDSQDNHYKKLS